jgi:hypothetical protein
VSVVRSALAGESASQIVEEIAAETSDAARRALGLDKPPAGMSPALASPSSVNARGARAVRSTGASPTSLPEMFASLLDISADVHHVETGHPAYVRLLTELAPDEARILRLFAQKGAQPAVDVRTKKPFGVGTRLLAPGITMIGLNAGCADPDRVPAYLNNLNRLGLIWFSRESVTNVDEYQVLEAQPEVIEAITSVKRATTVLRSIELTAFGKNFCGLCGLLDGDATSARASLAETSRQLPPPDAR